MTECVHWWQIGPPQPGQGPTSPGICQRCGEQREFRNYVESGYIMDYRSKVTRSRKKGGTGTEPGWRTAKDFSPTDPQDEDALTS